MRFIIALLLWTTVANAHEMTPTYPEFRRSYVDGIWLTTMSLFNRRVDVKYYEIDVFDDQWRSVPFASDSNVIRIEYLDKHVFDIYLRDTDIKRVKYICTRSRILKEDVQTSTVSSKICSKVK
jgi:hypothetical protein